MNLGKDFLKSGNLFRRGFRESPRTFMSEFYIVCIRHTDGRITEHHHITDPWRYIKKVKKAFDVEDAWISSK